MDEIKQSRKIKNAERYYPTINEGLTSELVNERVEDHLTNVKDINRSKSYFRIFVENIFTFCNTVTIILIIALVSVGAISDTLSSCIIFMNMFIGIFQEIKAKWAVEKLSFVVENSCDVIRDGKKTEISTKELVLDDIYMLRAGMQVPVDSILKSGYIEVDESILTGETAPIKKEDGNIILAGSNVLVGEVYVQAERVGKDCYIQSIAKAAKSVTKPRSNIFKSLDRIIKAISFILVPLAVLSAFVNYGAISAEGLGQSETITLTIQRTAAAVLGMLPVGMFLLTSFALAAGVLKLSKKNTLAQDLYSIEMLAMVDTLLLDKTGTITTGELQVVDTFKITDKEYDFNRIIASMLIATKDCNGTAKGLKNGYSTDEPYEALEALPFSSGRKYSAVTFKELGTFCIGAPDYLSDNVTSIQRYTENNSDIGRRTLILSKVEGSMKDINKATVTPLLAISLEDTVRSDAEETLRWFVDNDVDIKIISGDHPRTVSEIAKKTGVIGAENYFNCAGVSDEELEAVIEKITVFGRVSPEQKSLIVKYLQRKGKIVGMVGDGINDVQALKDADCSISFACANEVARNISRIVLIDSKFSSLPGAVAEGRRAICNVQKVAALYIMKNIFTIAFTLIYCCMWKVYPFTASQFVLIEFFVLGLPTFCLALQPAKKRQEGNFLWNVMKSSIPAGISLIVAVVVVFAITGAFNQPPTDNYYSTLGIYTLTFAGYSALLIISLPPDKFRLTVIAVSLALFSGIVPLIQWLNNPNFFSFDVVNIGWREVGYIAIGFAVATAVNVFIRMIEHMMNRKGIIDRFIMKRNIRKCNNSAD
ncbi:MAG: HAD family hydrolase [Clostridia bacterium]|nr:HAD family hydrolase [Clostridia bacterium]